MQRSLFIDKKGFTTFLWSAIFVSLAQNVAYITDPLFAGNNVCQEAIAAMNLYGPFLQLNFAFILLLAQGAMMLSAHALGKGDYDAIRKHFTVSITSLMIETVCVVALVWGFRYKIVDFLCPEQGLIHDLLYQYLSLMVFEMMTVSIYLSIHYFVSLDGHPEMSGKSSILLVCLQVSLAFTFSKFTNLGVRSFAAACIISEFISILYLGRYLFSPECSFKPQRLNGEYSKYFKANVKKGASQVIYNLAFMFALLIINQSVQRVSGENGAQAWSFAYVPVSVGILLYIAVAEVILAIGEVRLGEKDKDGLTYILKTSSRFIIIASIIVVTVSELFPDTIMSALGCNDAAQIDILRTPFRCSSAVIIAFAVVQLKSLGFVVIGKDRAYSVLTTIVNLFPAVFVGLCSLLFPSFFWWSFILAIALEFGLYVYMDRRLEKELDSLPDWNVPSMNISVAYEYESLGTALSEIKCFLGQQPQVSDETLNGIEHASEELMYNIIKHVPKKRQGDSFAVNVTVLPDSVDIIFKDAGRPFNPVISYDDKAADADAAKQKLQLALRLFNHYAANPSYKFCYGLNMTRLSFQTGS